MPLADSWGMTPPERRRAQTARDEQRVRHRLRDVPPVAERPDEVHRVADRLLGHAERALAQYLVEDLETRAVDAVHRERTSEDDVGAGRHTQVHELPGAN